MPDFPGGIVGSAEAIVAAFALFGVLAIIGRKIWRAVRHAAHFIDNTLPRVTRAVDDVIGSDGSPGLLDRLEAQDKELTRVLHELFPNGGDSLRDDIQRIQAGVTEARLRAAEAVDEATSLAAALGRADHKGSVERAELGARLETLMSSLVGFSNETRSRESAYIAALRDQGGPDLTGVADDADDGT